MASDSDLLLDVARIIKKHGADEFFSLAKRLSDPEYLAALRGALETLGKVAASIPKDLAAESRPTNPVLQEIRDRLMDREAYPHLRDILEEASRVGVAVPRSGFRGRKEAVAAITRHLAGASVEHTTEVLSHIRLERRRGSLEDWSDLIGESKRKA